MDEQMLEAVAKDVFDQAAEGYSVPVTNEVAQALGLFEENALSVDDVLADSVTFNNDSVEA